MNVIKEYEEFSNDDPALFTLFLFFIAVIHKSTDVVMGGCRKMFVRNMLKYSRMIYATLSFFPRKKSLFT